MVGGKKFPYTKKGIAAAKVASTKDEKKQLPRNPLNKSGLKKDGPGGKKGSLSMSVKKPLLISRKKIGGR
jgi:hypothetical protein